MALWKRVKGTRIPLPYKVQNPEEKYSLDLYRVIVQGKKPGPEAWRKGTKKNPASLTSVSSGRPGALYGGSPNYELQGLAVRATQGDPMLDQWRKTNGLFLNRGHMLAELSSLNYGDRHSLPLAVTVAYLQYPDHPSAEILRRQLLMFAVMARPIVAKDNKGRVLYRGFGWRPAGLRSLARHWDRWLESYLLARILGLDTHVTKLGTQEREYVELVERVVPKTQECLRSFASGAAFAELELFNWFSRKGGSEFLHSTAAPLRSPGSMSAIYARDVQSGETFSCLLGARVGFNTAATWAVHAKGPELADCTHCYAFRDRNDAPIKRVRTGKLKKAGPVMARVVSPDVGGVGVYVKGVQLDWTEAPSWLYDDTRCIRLELFHDKPAVLSLPK